MSALIITVVACIILLLVLALMDRVLTSWQSRKALENILKSKNKIDPRTLEDPKYGQVAGDADCLRVSDGKGSCSELRWSDVEEVHAYKRDLLTTDLICLAFKRFEKEDYYEIHEEMAGYHDLLEVLPSRLTGFTSEWFLSVAVPAFEANRRIIWKKPAKTLQ